MTLNVLLVSQISGYFISLILSLCIIIPMSLHQEEFRYVNYWFSLVINICNKT